MRIELYHDLPGNIGVVDRLAGLPVDALCVMVDRSSGKASWSFEDFAALVTRARAHGMEVRAVHWPRVSWDREQWERAVRFRAVAGMPSILDVEHQARGPKTRRRLAALAADRLGPDYIVSTHPWHQEATDPTHPNVQYEVQAYSTATALAKVGPKVLPPGWQVAQAERPCGPTRLALALYGQAGMFGGREPERYMERALRGAMACPNVGTVAYWSLKHLLRNKYAIPFLRDRVPEILGGTK